MATWRDFIEPADQDKGKKRKKELEAKDKPKQHILEGTIEVLPDCRYASEQTIRTRGLGSIFDTMYKTKRVTHRLDSNGYTVTLSVTKDLGYLNGAPGGSNEGEPTPEQPRRDPEPLKNAEEADYITVDKRTGETTIVR